MPAYDFFAAKKRVNVLKKVKVNGAWKLCPAVVEANGKLRDRVKVNGHVEVHPEGVYFLEWRDGKRVRESVRDKAEVLRRARARALNADPDGENETTAMLPLHPETHPLTNSTAPSVPRGPFPHPARAAGAAQLFLQAIESYIQAAVERAVGGQPHLPPTSRFVSVLEQPDIQTEPIKQGRIPPEALRCKLPRN